MDMKLEKGDSWRRASELARQRDNRLAWLIDNKLVPSGRGTTVAARRRHAETDAVWSGLERQTREMVERLKQNKIPRPRKR